MKKLTTLIFTLISLTNLTHASSCTDVRLDKNNGPLAGIPVYNQSYTPTTDSSMCYAFAGSQFIDAIRITNGGSKDIWTSPVTTALQTKLHPLTQWGTPQRLISEISRGAGSSGLGVGMINRMYEQLKNGYSCDKKSLEDFGGIKDPNAFWELFLLSYNEYAYGEANKNAIVEKLSESLKKLGLSEHFLGLLNTTFLHDVLTTKGFYLKEKKVYDLLCEDSKERLSLPDMDFHNFMPLDVTDDETDEEFETRFQVAPVNQNILSLIHSALNRKSPYPALIDICSEVLTDHKNSFKDSLPSFIGKCSPHTVVVIGRKENPETGKCEMLIRNSWGAYQDYDKEWESETNGQVWIPEEDLSSNVLNVLLAK